MSEYAFSEIEPKWQDCWQQQKAFAAANPGQPGSARPKFYVLDFFPYPSGAGLHVGHPLGYIASDIIARSMRMRGYNVLHPMGWDAFGLPAEQYAVETGVHPRETTQKNIATYKRQMHMIGLGYDWEREFATCDEAYYHWTQWIVLKIYNSWYDPERRWTDPQGRKVVGAARPIDELPIPPHVAAQGRDEIEAYRDEHRLAYLAEVPVNWCPALGTVLSNEEVTNEGLSDRGSHPVYRRPMRQWMLRITEYADRLLADLDELDWPESIKLMQRNWIGRSAGAYVDFVLAGDEENIIRVFTTRPDTLFGATYVVLAPEHRLVPIITTAEQREAVHAYVEQARQKSELDRTTDARAKTGVFTGAYAINPVDRRRVPIWVADYVLLGYGTGSIMAVPGSDTRDLEFAERFELDVLQVVEPPDGQDWHGFEGRGTAVNSPPVDAEHFTGQCNLNGLPTDEAINKITHWLEERDLGEGTIQYKLRDWLFSRQRYWGEPFPILCRLDGRRQSVGEEELPVVLPEIEDFKPHASDDPEAYPQTPLSRAPAQWRIIEREGVQFTRELNTMPQWAGSCWYYLRFADPHNDRRIVGPEAERYWFDSKNADGSPKIGGVDLYMGGAEHAVLHLLYARFWHKVLYDLGYVSTPEPFHKLFNQGMIQSYAYRDRRGVCVHYDDVEMRDDGAYHKESGEKLSESVEKMSKALKNVINPDQVIHEYGADTLRLYEMYMGPLEASKPWNPRDIVGVHRFLQRVWRLVIQPESEPGASVAGPAASAAWRINPKIGDQNDDGLERLLHKTIKKVQEDIERFALNTAIAQMIVWMNEAQKAERVGRLQIERFLLVLSPFAPHICEELWQRLGHAESLQGAAWPQYDPALTRDELVEMAVQILGKVRGRITVPAATTDEQIVEAARADEKVAAALAGKPIKRAIVVKGRLVNLIV
ncbi:MAG: leucine--tRNA ligase [Planctomycetes bacterium]|nr:leucine--tRNA ligase [Planctomycetota bacterium]